MSHLPHILTPLNLHLGREKSGVTVRIFVANRGDIMQEPGDMPNEGAKNKAKKVQPTEKTGWNCQIGQTAEGFMTIPPRTHASPKKT
jgi:hypothetical protein